MIRAAAFLLLVSMFSVPARGAELPPGFVRLAEVAPQIRQEMRYATSHNFVGRPVVGYDAGDCWLLADVAAALARAAEDARPENWRLVVFDCYRPERAVADFVAWSKDPKRQERKAEFYPDIDKSRLFKAGFIASRSQHSKGTTVDLGADLVAADGTFEPVDFGTPFDMFAKASATRSAEVTAEVKAARELLVRLLSTHGFENYSKEWWHFSFPVSPVPRSWDIPITKP